MIEPKINWKTERTGRGFKIIEFLDYYSQSCSLQQSSLAEYTKPGSAALWLGVEGHRMHLSFGQVKMLIIALETWMKDCKFPDEVGYPEHFPEERRR